MDIATLGIKVDSGQVTQAGSALDQFTAKAGQAEAATRRFERVEAAGYETRRRAADAIRQQAAAYQAQQAAVVQVSVATERVATTSVRSIEGIGRFKNAIANLGLAAVGIQGPMGKIVETLGAFAVGSAVLTGILAGIAAIAAVFAKLTEQTRRAQEAYDKYMDSLRKQGPLDAIGGQLDEVQHKLDNMGDNFLGRATRFTRGLFASGNKKTILGMLFGVQSAEELEQQAKDLGKQYGDAFVFGQNDAYTKGKAAEAERQKKALADIEARKKAEIEYWNIRNNGQTTFRGNLPLEFGGRGGAYGAAGGDIPAFLQGQRPDGLPPFQPYVDDSKKIAESWQSVSASVANVVTLLANADDVTSQMLGTVVTIVGQIEDAVKAGKLSVTGVAGLVAGGVSLLASAFGESPADRRRREIAEANTEALRQLKKSLDTANLGTGNQYAAARAGTNALFGAFQQNPNQFLSGLGGLNTGAVQSILRGSGTNLSDLREYAKATYGITLDTSGVASFADGLIKLKKAIDDQDLVRLNSFSGQLDLIGRQWSLLGTGPVEKLADLLKLAQGPQGSSHLAGLFNGLDLSQRGDRNFARDQILRELQRAQSGNLSTADLGGLTLQQYLDYLSQFGALLNEANASLQATVDSLQTFADSLKLDQGLTTLSPAQQLAEARRQYESVLQAALGGDQAAAGRLPDVARQFLSASRGYNASGVAYAADFARVLADTDAAQKLFKGQEEGWKALEKPMVNVADNTKATNDKLDVVIGLLAELGVTTEKNGQTFDVRLSDLTRTTKRGFTEQARA